ncbi:hypothetical protein QA612_04005 [Evansella sp. AB-P1]|uniref:hypothetical protein n=1 Tax=Evansella sp. AB-P1 TaxID=3037653 RepID=UPI00241E01A4|nr:hypothetical protein [Evansella sp. AB-P1]MDG5786643.1 hypothetical protein [Evansella sp. AB-P1]
MAFDWIYGFYVPAKLLLSFCRNTDSFFCACKLAFILLQEHELLLQFLQTCFYPFAGTRAPSSVPANLLLSF